MILSEKQLLRCFPFHKDIPLLTKVLNKHLTKNNIYSPYQVAAFLSQTSHESRDYTRFEENLNYSAPQLLKTWPNRFSTLDICLQYAKNPIKIANKVYSNRMGNGDELSCDGWNYRGCGAIQLTGKDNHSKFAVSRNIPLNKVHDYLITLEGAIDSACYFWLTNKLNTFADKQDIVGLTKAINGGIIGLDSRVLKYNKFLAIFKEDNK